mmetsp:Transcript_138910/g.241543  ORF Transcript_138910/g.241543 Transcript_138910/m.241543 type:complete len:515 (-) Transcript_138910:1138-2682(-)
MDHWETWLVKDYLNYTRSVTIPRRYKIEHELGCGTGGIVCAAVERSGEKRKVAVKNVTKRLSNPREATKVLRELKIMRHLVACPQIVTLYAAFRSPATEACPMGEVYIVMELMNYDLGTAIQNQTMDEDHCSYFVYELLKGVAAMHEANILHRDLKPQNVLVNDDCSLKICDFGMGRGCTEDDQTEYVCTRWYRAPEILMSTEYDKPADIFSVGCIFGEMLKSVPCVDPERPRLANTRFALFPGASYLDQLRLILTFVGYPSDEDIQQIHNDNAQRCLVDRFQGGLPPRPPLGQYFPKVPSEDSLALLDHLLKFNPQKRWTAEQALQSPYLCGYDDYDDDDNGSKSPKLQHEPFDASFEDQRDLSSILQLLEDEINQYATEIAVDDAALAPTPGAGPVPVAPVAAGPSLEPTLGSRPSPSTPLAARSPNGTRRPRPVLTPISRDTSMDPSDAPQPVTAPLSAPSAAVMVAMAVVGGTPENAPFTLNVAETPTSQATSAPMLTPSELEVDMSLGL